MAKRKPRRSVGLGWVVTWPLLPVFALVVFLAAEEMHRPHQEAPPIANGPDWEEQLQGRIERVTVALRNSSLDLSDPAETMTGSGSIRYLHRSYRVTFHPEKQVETELAIEALREVDPGLTLSRTPTDMDGFEVKIGVDGLLTHTVRFRALQPASAPPRVALIIRGLGDDLRLAREFVRIDAPIALGIRPARPFSKEVAELARLFDREVLLDLSFVTEEPRGENVVGIVPIDGRLRSRLETALRSVPHAVGVTADVDKELASDSERLVPLLVELKRRGLFYVSDVPDLQRFGMLDTVAGVIVAMDVAVASGAEPVELTERLGAIGTRARSDGLTVTVTNPTAEVLDVLRATPRRWEAKGIDLVPVSSLLRTVVGQVAR